MPLSLKTRTFSAIRGRGPSRYRGPQKHDTARLLHRTLQTNPPLTPTHPSRIPPRTQSERDHQLRVQSERMDRERCVKAVTAHSDDAKIRGVRSVSVDVLPCNPANGVAETIEEYCDMQRADIVVVGSRGAGSLRRSMLSLVGLGSVSEHLARHLTSAALMIVKRPPVVSTKALS